LLRVLFLWGRSLPANSASAGAWREYRLLQMIF
jgi:hypothetical protein